MDDLRFGAAIRVFRVRRRLRQGDLAALAQASPATVSRVERGLIDRISLGTIRRIARAERVRRGGRR